MWRCLGSSGGGCGSGGGSGSGSEIGVGSEGGGGSKKKAAVTAETEEKASGRERERDKTASARVRESSRIVLAHVGGLAVSWLHSFVRTCHSSRAGRYDAALPPTSYLLPRYVLLKQ